MLVVRLTHTSYPGHLIVNVQIKRGKATPILAKAPCEDNLCLSVVTPGRNLDLQAVTPALREQWVVALDAILQHINMAPPEHVKVCVCVCECVSES
jgi:hypothetical protein